MILRTVSTFDGTYSVITPWSHYNGHTRHTLSITDVALINNRFANRKMHERPATKPYLNRRSRWLAAEPTDKGKKESARGSEFLYRWNCSRFMSSRSSAIQIFQPLLLASAMSSQPDEAQKETDIEMEGNNFPRQRWGGGGAWIGYWWTLITSI